MGDGPKKPMIRSDRYVARDNSKFRLFSLLCVVFFCMAKRVIERTMEQQFISNHSQQFLTPSVCMTLSYFLKTFPCLCCIDAVH